MFQLRFVLLVSIVMLLSIAMLTAGHHLTQLLASYPEMGELATPPKHNCTTKALVIHLYSIYRHIYSINLIVHIKRPEFISHSFLIFML